MSPAAPLISNTTMDKIIHQAERKKFLLMDLNAGEFKLLGQTQNSSDEPGNSG